MGWLFYTLLLVCCFSVKADEAPTWAELNELNSELEKVESGLRTENRLERIENLLLENQKLLKGEIMSRLEEVEGKLDSCQPRNPTTTGPTTRPKNCQDVYKNGGQVSGVYSIFPNGTEEVQVFCEQELQEGGWTVFQRRIDGTVNFYRGWDDYKQGFGSAEAEYWIGNDHLHQLTANLDTELLVELEYGNETLYAKYEEFWVLSEGRSYILHVADYTGGSPPGDSLGYHNGLPFSTKDRDNDRTIGHCAQRWGGCLVVRCLP